MATVSYTYHGNRQCVWVEVVVEGVSKRIFSAIQGYYDKGTVVLSLAVIDESISRTVASGYRLSVKASQIRSTSIFLYPPAGEPIGPLCIGGDLPFFKAGKEYQVQIRNDDSEEPSVTARTVTTCHQDIAAPLALRERRYQALDRELSILERHQDFPELHSMPTMWDLESNGFYIKLKMIVETHRGEWSGTTQKRMIRFLNELPWHWGGVFLQLLAEDTPTPKEVLIEILITKLVRDKWRSDSLNYTALGLSVDQQKMLTDRLLAHDVSITRNYFDLNVVYPTREEQRAVMQIVIDHHSLWGLFAFPKLKHLTSEDRFEYACLLGPRRHNYLLQFLDKLGLNHDQQVLLAAHMTFLSPKRLEMFTHLNDNEKGEAVLQVAQKNPYCVYTCLEEFKECIPRDYSARLDAVLAPYFEIERALDADSLHDVLRHLHELNRDHPLPMTLVQRTKSLVARTVFEKDVATRLEVVREINTFPSSITLELVRDAIYGFYQKQQPKNVDGTSCSPVVGDLLLETADLPKDLWRYPTIYKAELGDMFEAFGASSCSRGVVIFNWGPAGPTAGSHHTLLYLEQQDTGVTQLLISDSLGKQGADGRPFTLELIRSVRNIRPDVELYAVKPLRQRSDTGCHVFTLNDLSVIGKTGHFLDTTETRKDAYDVHWIRELPMDMMKITQSTTEMRRYQQADELIRSSAFPVEGIEPGLTTFSQFSDRVLFWVEPDASPRHVFHSRIKQRNFYAELLKARMLEQALELEGEALRIQTAWHAFTERRSTEQERPLASVE